MGCTRRWKASRTTCAPTRGRGAVAARGLHAEYAEAPLLDRRVHRCRDGQAEYATRVGRVDDAVVPQPRAGVIGMTLALVLVAHGRLEGFFVLRAPCATTGFDAIAADRGQHRRGLLATHHADARVGPHPQEPGAIGTAAHGVVARAETATDHDGEFRDMRA